MKRKTSELTDLTLDWAVAKCQGHPGAESTRCGFEDGYGSGRVFGAPNYSGDWSLGGPIMDAAEIDSYLYERGSPFGYIAEITGTRAKGKGPTRLIAAMRCYVANEMGYEVDVPEEFL